MKGSRKLANQELVPATESLPQLSELQLAEQELNAQERLFCYGWLVSYNATKAGAEVDMSKSAAIRLLKKPSIVRFIKLLSDDIAEESLITREMVQHEIVHEFLPMAKGQVEISGMDRDGIQFTGKVTNMAAYGKAIDLMAKHSGFTAPEIVKGGLTININHKALGIEGTAIDISDGEVNE
jgi:hypothetical protein